MKSQKILQIGTLLFILSLVSANYSRADILTASIDLSTNMVCGSAEGIIEKALNKVDGIIEVKVDTQTKKAIVTYDDGKINLEVIEKEITKAGYDANEKKADPEAYEKLPDCCKTK